MTRRDPRLLLLVAATMLGALLSFTLEPMVGRLVVPYFGGAVHVWTVCMMVFQGLLLLGYAWAHLVAPRIGGWHLVALALAAAWLPVHFDAEVAPEAPLATLVARLLLTVGPPFWALTTTTVVAQNWLARSPRGAGVDPYPLYAASNAGSLVGLLAYVLVVEPLAGLGAQRVLWSVGYLAYFVVTAAAWWLLRPGPAEPPTPTEGPAPNPTDRLAWVLLAAGPSALLLAVTNSVATEIGSFPLVWVVPLALYLLSFVIAFRERALPRAFLASWPDALLATLSLVTIQLFVWVVPALYAAFFWVCLVFHGALHARRPHPRHLTTYYLSVALGGWLGGLMVSVGAPLLLDGLWEGMITVALMMPVGAWLVGLDEVAWWREAHITKGGARLALRMASVALVCAYGWFNIDASYVARQRSFYGVFQVRELTAEDGARYRIVTHGSTVHGTQYLEPGRAQPMAYYHEGGPIQRAWSLRRRPARSAVVGLGAGAMAWWVEPDEHLVYYEIDPQNEPLARRWFSYLDRAADRAEVRVGDARLVLQEEPDQALYAVLLVDAFSGDGIPMHLLTLEAFQVWTRRVAPDGLLLLHVSNRFYDLRGVVGTVAAELGWSAVWRLGRSPVETFDDPLVLSASVIALARDPARLEPLREEGWTPLAPDGSRLWTDDWSTVLAPMWKGLTATE